jgi:60 kDa SS-A/Ro ribonucleoprotein
MARVNVRTRLLVQERIGALALVRNLRNMEQVGVDTGLILDAIDRARAADVWPWQALAAAQQAPTFEGALDELILRSAGALPKLGGKTGVLVDVSGSMNDLLSAKSIMRRLDAAYGVAIVAAEMCPGAIIASFSNTIKYMKHDLRGIKLAAVLHASQPHEGTNMTKAVDNMLNRHKLDRIIVISDEQSYEYVSVSQTLRAYIINVASYQRGVDWHGEVTRINGWSGNIVRFIAQLEGKSVLTAPEELDDDD